MRFQSGLVRADVFPVSSLITQETIWNDSWQAGGVSHWGPFFHKLHISKAPVSVRRLHLQLCNALFRNKAEIDTLARLRADDPDHLDDESDPRGRTS